MTTFNRPSLSRSARTFLVSGALIVLGLFLMRWFVLDWQIIPPGYTGVKINRLVDQGTRGGNPPRHRLLNQRDATSSRFFC